MRRNFLLGFLICLVPSVLSTVFVGMGFYRESLGEAGFRRGIDLAGGTILVYEVNTEKLKKPGQSDGDEAAGLSNEDIKKLAESLKRRIDRNDLRNVIVRPVGTSRIEIILPRSASTTGGKQGSTEDFVQETKALVRQVGVLEFRILANSIDDSQGFAEARSLIDRAKSDPKPKADLEELARRGLPPTPPSSNYSVTVNGGTEPNTNYFWVELGKSERNGMGVSNMYAAEGPKSNPLAREGDKRSLWLYPQFETARKADGGLFAKAGVLMEYEGILYLTREFTKTSPSSDEDGKQFEYFVLTRVSPVDQMKVDRDVGLTARADQNKLEPAVAFSLNSTGAGRFGKMTERNKAGENGFKRRLAIILDEKVVSAPSLNSVIRDSGSISGNFKIAEVNSLVNILRSGALNAELKPDPVSENTVGATLGEDTIRKGLWAVGLSFAAVLAFMVVYYRFAGIVACIALLANLLFTIGFMVSVNAAFTLPGLAGIVLMLGMAVDANVLIYERVREERTKGANLQTAIRLGYERAFATIIDTHLTSIFTCIVLYAFGNDNLKGFSVSLTVGLLISLFTALFMTRLIFDYAVVKRYITDLQFMQLFARPNFDFMRLRKVMFTITGTLTVVGLALFVFRGEAGLNVDFTKGTAYGGRLAEGQERALGNTDKKGFLTLLGEESQRDRLKVKDAILAQPGDIDGRNADENVYEVTYADDTKAIVTFVNRPDGNDTAARRDDVMTRAAQLPGLSVEQVYLGGESFGSGKSRSFTIRTTEKEPELVQVMLDRLLRDETSKEPLLASTKVTGLKVEGTTAIVILDKPASPKYLESFLERELKLINRWPSISGVKGISVTGVETKDNLAASTEEGRSGKYATIAVDVGMNPEFKPLKDAIDAKKPIVGDKNLETAQADFKRSLDKAIVVFSARPIPDRLETFDPALAADTRNKAFYAILASWVAILGYLWFRFGNWTFGLAAVCCLVHDLCFTLGAIAICHYLYDNPFGQLLQLHDFKIDLAAVAALLTLVGYSVNDTIVVFDRIREVRGKNPLLTPQMINDSVNQTLSRTVLASLTVFLVVGVLYLFGGEGVHLVSFVMVVGVLVGTYSSIYIASPLLLIFGEGKPKFEAMKPMGAAMAKR